MPNFRQYLKAVNAGRPVAENYQIGLRLKALDPIGGLMVRRPFPESCLTSELRSLSSSSTKQWVMHGLLPLQSPHSKKALYR